MGVELSTLAFAFGLTLFAGLATGIGGLIAVMKRNPGPQFIAGALGLSAGVMLYVSMMELLPAGVESLGEEMGERPANWLAVGAFFAGILLIAVIDRLVPEDVNPHGTEGVSGKGGRGPEPAMMKTGVMTAVAIGIHNFPEGFATFISGLEDLTIALSVALAIAIHNIPEGIAVAVPIREATGDRRKAVRWATLSGLAEPAGALVGFLLFMPLMGPLTLGLVFPLVAGIMVFISLDELLPAAIATGKNHAAIYGLVLGMAIMALSLLLFI